MTAELRCAQKNTSFNRLLHFFYCRMPLIVYLCTLEISSRFHHDRNQCKVLFRVKPKDRCELRADTFASYPTRLVGGWRAFGGDS